MFTSPKMIIEYPNETQNLMRISCTATCILCSIIECGVYYYILYRNECWIRQKIFRYSRYKRKTPIIAPGVDG